MANDQQTIHKAKGRPLLQWVGKKPLEKVEYFPAQEKEVYGDKQASEFNKLFWGDNMQVLSHLLKEYRGKVDLIYIDPPFDSKADYVKKVKIRGEQVEGIQQGLLEEKQYTDIWANDEYLQFMYERLLIMRELLAETGSILVHCDWHRSHYLRLILEEIFGEDHLQNEIIWQRTDPHNDATSRLGWIHDTIYWFSKGTNKAYNWQAVTEALSDAALKEYSLSKLPDGSVVSYKPELEGKGRRFKLDDCTWKGSDPSRQFEWRGARPSAKRVWPYDLPGMEAALDRGEFYLRNPDQGAARCRVSYLDEREGQILQTIWTEVGRMKGGNEYPTQKPEALISRIVLAFSNPGDLVLDCFMGSGTTAAAAQQSGRRWIGCDINLGAIQTTTKRLNQIIEAQQKDKQLPADEFKGSHSFKVYAVNDYDIFKNELEAKEIVMDIYGIEPIKRSYFDGVLDVNYVKIMPLNRVLNKLDVATLLKTIDTRIDDFKPKATSTAEETIYEQGVLVICSGIEPDALNYLKKENRTGVAIQIRDLLTDKKNLIFKEKPEADVAVTADSQKLNVVIQDFFSPILMRKLELENEKRLKDDAKARVEDFKQIIDSVAIDVDYDGQLFNAEIIDLPTKRELIKAEYEWQYKKSGKYVVAIKIVDVLGEEAFETYEVEA